MLFYALWQHLQHSGSSHVDMCSQVLPNMTAMLQQLTLNYAAGQVLWAYHTLLLLSFLLDPQLSGTTPQPDPTLDPNASAKAALGLEGLVQLLDLVIASEEEERNKAENLMRQLSTAVSDSDSDIESDSEAADEALGASTSSSPAQAATAATGALAASLGPILIRMLNGVAALLTGIAEELQALQWLLGQLQNQPALPPAVSPSVTCSSQCLCVFLHTSSSIVRLMDGREYGWRSRQRNIFVQRPKHMATLVRQ